MTDRDATDDTTDGLVVLDEQGRPVTLTMRPLPRRRPAMADPPPMPVGPPLRPDRPPERPTTLRPAPRAPVRPRGRAVPVAGLLAVAALGGTVLVLVAGPGNRPPPAPPVEAKVTVAPMPAAPMPAAPAAVALPPAPAPRPTPPPPPPAAARDTATAAKRVFVHHRAGDPGAAAAARRVADALTTAGFAVPEIRTVPGAVAATRVRFFFDADAAAAARVGSLAARALGRPAAAVGVQDFRFYAQKPRTDTLEIWVEAP